MVAGMAGSLWRFLGLDGEGSSRGSGNEPDSVRRIAARLESLEPTRARYLAAFAYVLARVAHADLSIDEDETTEMQRIVAELASLGPEEASLAVEIAKSQARMLGGTENYVVTREFRRISSKQQRAELVECLYAVAAADGSISNTEDSEIASIADELGFSRPETSAIRASFREHLAVLRS